jgi:hypothetical protein
MDVNISYIKKILQTCNVKISPDIYKTQFIKNLESCITSNSLLPIKKLKNNELLVKKYNLPKLNNNNKSSLSYILFSTISDLGDLCSFMKFCPLLDNYDTFKKWYLYHQRYINIDKLKKYTKESSNDLIKKIYESMFSPSFERIKIHKMLYENNFVSHSIQYNYENNDLILEIYKSSELELEHELDFDIYIYRYPYDNTNYIEIIISILQIMRCLMKLYDIKPNHLELVFFASDEKKTFPIKGEQFTSENVNSGSCFPGKSINIWRREELLKVLIHELIHFYKIDFHEASYNYDKLYNVINNNIKLDEKLDSIDSCNESYTESLALIIHTYIISKLTKEDFLKLLLYEILFTASQILEIVKHHNGKTIRDIFRIKFNQSTSVRSYFLIKFMILLNLEMFLMFVDKNNLKIEDNITDYANLINNFIFGRKYIFDILETHKTNSLKMSLFDILSLVK